MFKMLEDGVYLNTGNPRKDIRVLVREDEVLAESCGLGEVSDELVQEAWRWLYDNGHYAEVNAAMERVLEKLTQLKIDTAYIRGRIDAMEERYK